MISPIRALVLAGIVGFASLVPATQAVAAPIALQFNVNVDRLCDPNATNCHTVSVSEIVSYVFDDTIVGGSGFDVPSTSFLRTVFAGGGMTLSGPLVDLANPFGSDTNQSSAWINVNEERQPVGPRFAQSDAEDLRTYDQWTPLPDGGLRRESWLRQVQISRSHPSATGGDGQANATASDFLDELAGGTLSFVWYTYAFTTDCPAGGGCVSVVDPRSFYATGTATLVATPAVPEPGTLLLLGTGLLAGFRSRSPARRLSSRR